MDKNVLFQKGKKPKTVIFRSKITINGVTYKAKDYGNKAWPIPIY